VGGGRGDAHSAALSFRIVATIVRDPEPVELQQLRERREALGLDRRDEVWEGVLHMNPPPSHGHERLLALLIRVLGPYADAAGLEVTGGIGIGVQNDYRVPDLALHRPGAAEQWHPTVALAVEIVSPGDETWEKLPFYAAHDVDELVIVDPQERRVHWFALQDGKYGQAARSSLIELGPQELAEQIPLS
jgi:Uma2 family endonuclease